MGVKWTESRNTIVTDWSAYRALIVRGTCYTDSIVKEKE